MSEHDAPTTGPDRDADDLGYEPFALQYDRGSADNPYNTLLERPALRELLGPVRGLRVLEAGCAGGRLSARLADDGARVLGLDVSPSLVAAARERAGDRAEFRVHDLREPLDFLETGSVDRVVSSLTLHYVADWVPVLTEFRRVLAPGGRVVISTHHPFDDLELSEGGDYFAVERLTDTWTSYGPPPMVVRFYRRPLGDMVAAAHAAGLAVRDLREPRATEEHRAAFGDKKFPAVATRPRFLLLDLTPDPGR
ncbi:class I SAM-dependent methyltransferase [Streptomyces capillispiralis]|uniref:Methyltransferase family protein n=1 Tax=Streptomyces capillispiralis TaxID=68182 RepID=A0A561TBZ1_9ACTN|nr:class I SAM-dependent methyltransferase [Streptomyces capillispiralis]TWF84616.1 methyltransferase family protein [Streptomyces capillispiralis]GHH95919.1 SAM-dependent methyltransferase [Streptomyces capillispiralis]